MEPSKQRSEFRRRCQLISLHLSFLNLSLLQMKLDFQLEKLFKGSEWISYQGAENFNSIKFNRVYARREQAGRTEFALDSSIKFLKELERYAKYDYELPKMYSAAIPDFAGEKIV